jgi:hypothetical protein
VHGHNVGAMWAIAGQKLKSKYLEVTNQSSILAIGREEHSAHTFRNNAIDLGVQIALRK